MILGDVMAVGRSALTLLVDCIREVAARVAPWIDGGPPRSSVPRPRPAGPGDEVESAKFFLAATPVAPHAAEEPAELPRAYGVDRAVLLARDPQTLFIYWEITPFTRVTALRRLGTEAEQAHQVLRLTSVRNGVAVHVRDVELPAGVDRWYLDVPSPGAAYRIEVGLRLRGGRFVSLVRSNQVAVPAAQPSEDTTVRWVRLRRDAVPRPAESSGWSGRRIAERAPDPAAAADPRSSDVHAPR